MIIAIVRLSRYDVFIETTIIYINYQYYRVVIACVTPASSHDSVPRIKSIVTLFHIMSTGSLTSRLALRKINILSLQVTTLIESHNTHCLSHYYNHFNLKQYFQLIILSLNYYMYMISMMYFRLLVGYGYYRDNIVYQDN